MAETIIAMAHNPGLGVTAEGGDRFQSDTPKGWRRNLAQGYLIGRPVPAETFLEMAALQGRT